MFHRTNGKPSPRKNVRHRQKGESKSNFQQDDVEESSDDSNPKAAITSKDDETDSGIVFLEDM